MGLLEGVGGRGIYSYQ